MYNKRRSLGKIIALAAVCCVSVFTAGAQYTDALGSYSPYSVFGIGRLANSGSAYNQAMGGIGIGMRDNKVINSLNPASITARDTLSFMLDFGINQQNIYSNDSRTKAAYNIFNMQNVSITLPIYRSSAFIVGLAPYSGMGYKFLSTENSQDIVADIGDVKYRKYATGGIYQLYFGAAAMFFKRISIGVQGTYYFGFIDKHNDVLFNSSSAYNTIYAGWDYKVRTITAKGGLQYIQPLGKAGSELVVGGTYQLGSRFRGDVVSYAMSASDTVFNSTPTVETFGIAEELGVGISYRHKAKWAVGVDFIQQNWHKNTFPDNSTWEGFSTAVARSYKAGFEITPNVNDIRYYMRRATYRAGVYFNQTYLSVNGHQINEMGLTLGLRLPINKYYNAMSLAVDLGQRGTLRHGLIRERYINFVININLHDIWFVKYKYD